MTELVERVAQKICCGTYCGMPAGCVAMFEGGSEARAAITEIFNWLEQPMSSEALNAGAAIVGNDADAFDAFQHMLAVRRKEAGV